MRFPKILKILIFFGRFRGFFILPSWTHISMQMQGQKNWNLTPGQDFNGQGAKNLEQKSRTFVAMIRSVIHWIRNVMNRNRNVLLLIMCIAPDLLHCQCEPSLALVWTGVRQSLALYYKQKSFFGTNSFLKGVLSSHKSVTGILLSNPTMLPPFSVFMNFHLKLSDSCSGLIIRIERSQCCN